MISKWKALGKDGFSRQSAASSRNPKPSPLGEGAFTNASTETALLIRLQEKHKQFEFYTVGGIARGVSPDVAEAHVVPDGLFEMYDLEAGVLRRSISGKKIKRYSHATADQWLIYTAKGMEPKEFPRTYAHLHQFRSKNTCKEVIEGKHPGWALHRPRNPAIFESPKFIGLTTTKKIEIVLDLSDNLFVTDAMYVFRLKNGIHPNAALAVLHSKAFLSLYRISNQGEARVIPQIKAAKLGILPFPNLKDGPIPNKTVRLVEQMLIAKAQLVDAVTENDRDYLMDKCAAFDRQIDALVYELYGMTESEIRLVEAME